MKFFTRQTELEKLVVKFVDNRFIEIGDDSIADGPKILLFQILKSCRKLTYLTFGLNDYDFRSSARFNKDDALEFSSLMRSTRIRMLGLSEMCFRNMLHPFSAETNDDGSEKSNFSIIEEIYNHLLGRPEKVLEMRLSLENCTEIATILSSRVSNESFY